MYIKPTTFCCCLHSALFTPAEETIAQFFETRLEEIGLDVSSAQVADGRRNVWGRLKGHGSGPTIMLATDPQLSAKFWIPLNIH